MFQSTALSEITAYPLGFIIYFNPKDNITYEGIDITSLSDFDYNEIATVTFPLCIKEMNDVFPAHYRFKVEIMKCIENNKVHIE